MQGSLAYKVLQTKVPPHWAELNHASRAEEIEKMESVQVTLPWGFGSQTSDLGSRVHASHFRDGRQCNPYV